MSFVIRPYHASDLCALYRICLRTGAHGTDASPLYRDCELLGHYFAGPYAVLEPDLCFVLAQCGTPCGYVLGTRNTASFSARCEQDWFPVLRARYPRPAEDDQSDDARLIRLIHSGHQVNPDLTAYPAHLHIDLLPLAQGQGWGRQLMCEFRDRLRALAVPAVHLGVGIRNTRALRFYQRAGFHAVKTYEGWIAFG